MRSLLFTCLNALFFTTLAAQTVYVCRVDPTVGSTSAAFTFEETVSFELDYDLLNTQAQILITPLSEGVPTPNVSLLDTPGLESGEGTINRSFRVSGPDIQIVDELLVQLLNEDGSEEILVFAIPLRFYFGPASVSNFQFSANRDFSSFLTGETVELSFDYEVAAGDAIQVLTRPSYEGQLLSDISATNETTLSGSGTHSQSFAVDAGINQKADAIFIQVISDNLGEVAGFSLPVNYVWSSVKLTNVSAPSSDLYSNGEDLSFAFDYSGNAGNGELQLTALPYSDGDPTMSSSNSGNLPLAASGNLSSSTHFTVDSTNQRINAIQLKIRSNDDNTLLLSADYPVDLYFGDFFVSNLTYCPPSPARLLPGGFSRGFMDYSNISNDSVRMFVRARVSGTGIGFSGAQLVEPGDHTVFFLTRVDGPRTSFGHRALPTIPDGTRLADFRYSSSFFWGDPMVSSTYSPGTRQKLDWNLGPNPTSDQSQFRLEALQDQQLQLELYDLSGRPLHQWPVVQLTAGATQTITIDRTTLGLSSGSYFLLVRGAGYHLVERLIIQ
ncbi:MAG: T9SS type A sorting domain-containing protein [Bacteroidota bacterium]